MQRHTLTLILCLIGFIATAQKESSTIYVDKKGVMRWSDSQAEASFFGVNYTLPFAHAYRAIGYLGKNHKDAINKDVYHFARLGFNAYRIHVWDVEISDSVGNLLENEHLDLLDYLIYKLKERNIKVVITAMTNFGNGYPERNRQTGGFSYLYDKCEIHTHPEARKAQQNYITQLVRHINPYTGKAYMEDTVVVGFEINNEPCHKDTRKETADYINGMLASLKKAGNRKPVFYNVSHNMEQIEAYYSTGIQGTTYQWYPTGLVAGQTRKGNFLPQVDDFNIPFKNVKGFDNKARLVYEYDPADITYSYMHPAMVRSFRTAGFQWITQFAYDPLDMACYNTEYQTHYLNLAYTPQKALSMKIAAEAAYSVPLNHSYGVYPADTIFGDFRVSYTADLSELNRKTKFYYSNHTDALPVSPENLESIAGYGCSPVVKYEGTGAYFLDKLEEGVWRLEVMPDAVQVADPFAKPSLQREVVVIIRNKWDLQLHIPDLGSKFHVQGLNEGNHLQASASEGMIPQVEPGVYLLRREGLVPRSKWEKDSRWENIILGEYVAPDVQVKTYSVVHTPKTIESGKAYMIEAMIAGPGQPDSVIIYTDHISFWRNHNTHYKMERTDGYKYRAIIPADAIHQGVFKYNILVCHAGGFYTFPSGVNGNPLDWDYTASVYFESRVVDPESVVRLFSPQESSSVMHAYAIPEYNWLRYEPVSSKPPMENLIRFSTSENKEKVTYFLRKYIADEISGRRDRLKDVTSVCLHLQSAPSSVHIGFVTNKGYTYKTTFTPQKGIHKIALNELEQTVTALLPHAYPVFLKKYFEPEISIPFKIEDIEILEFSFEGEEGKATEFEVGTVWME